MPSLDALTESLIQEQDKLIQMGVLNASKNKALLSRDSRNVQEKGKQRGKENKNVDSKTKEKHNPSNGASGSKKNKNNKFEKAQLSYCMRGFHPKSHCMKNTFDQMEKLLEHHNISLPEGARKNDSGEQTEDHDERCHALKASCSKTHAFLIDSGDSNNMVSYRESFSSL